MHALIAQLRRNSFIAHLLALSCMVVASALMYVAAQKGLTSWIWVLIGLFILGNLLELVIR
jgi:hypothetical protein